MMPSDQFHFIRLLGCDKETKTQSVAHIPAGALEGSNENCAQYLHFGPYNYAL
jgi:hypothetical protein